MTDTATKTETDIGLTSPNLWEVKIFNDDFTPMDFVIEILTEIFNKPHQEAIDMTLRVHEDGAAIVGTYTKEIADTKVIRATRKAEGLGHPLRLIASPQG